MQKLLNGHEIQDAHVTAHQILTTTPVTARIEDEGALPDGEGALMKIYGDSKLGRKQALTLRQYQDLLAKQPTMSQKTFGSYAIPYDRFRGVTWLSAKDKEWVVDIHYSIFGKPNKRTLWMEGIPCKILMANSGYFEGVLKQQVKSTRAKIVLSVTEGKEDVQLAALRRLVMFMLQPPLDTQKPRVSKELFYLNSAGTDVMEMGEVPRLGDLKRCDRRPAHEGRAYEGGRLMPKAQHNAR